MQRRHLFRLTFASFLIVLGALAIVFRPAWPGAAPQSVDAVDPAAVFAGLETRRNWSGVSAVSAAVLTADGDVETYAAGWRSDPFSEPVSTEDAFEVASLSKPVTAYAVLRLARQGLLDLDEAREVGGQAFTLRQVLQHSAGFDNALTRPFEPVGPAGAFRYAGMGYLYLAEVIEDATGQDFAEHMNTVVLPELGMKNSAFGVWPGQADLVMPAIDAGLVVAMALLCAGLVVFVLTVPACLISLLAGWTGGRGLWLYGLVAMSVGLAAGIAAPVFVLGGANQILSASVAVLALMMVALIYRLSVQPSRVGRALALLMLVAVASVGFVRPPLPIAERPAVFLAPAGLRTMPSDYLVFLQTVMAEPEGALTGLVSTPVPVTDHTDWGLGIGVTRGDNPALWHWGINFPGYQAFAVAWPETGEIAVIAMAGGQMAFSPDGMRFAGLEMALEALAEGGAPVEGSWWNGIQ